jgi:hypothetical protein
VRLVVKAGEKKNCDVSSLFFLCDNVYSSWEMVALVAFKVYDMDRDGYISNGELFLVLKMMVGSNLKVCIQPLVQLRRHRLIISH